MESDSAPIGKESAKHSAGVTGVSGLQAGPSRKILILKLEALGTLPAFPGNLTFQGERQASLRDHSFGGFHGVHVGYLQVPLRLV